MVLFVGPWTDYYYNDSHAMKWLTEGPLLPLYLAGSLMIAAWLHIETQIRSNRKRDLISAIIETGIAIWIVCVVTIMTMMINNYLNTVDPMPQSGSPPPPIHPNERNLRFITISWAVVVAYVAKLYWDGFAITVREWYRAERFRERYTDWIGESTYLNLIDDSPVKPRDGIEQLQHWLIIKTKPSRSAETIYHNIPQARRWIAGAVFIAVLIALGYYLSV